MKLIPLHYPLRQVGRKMQKRILLMFSAVAVVPTALVAIFSIIFFNQGIQAWFDDRVGTALNEAVEVAEGYYDEHRKNIEADLLAVSGELNRNADKLIQNPKTMTRLLQTLAALRQLTEARLIRSPQKEARLQLPDETIILNEEDMARAAKGMVAVITSENDDKVRAITQLSAFPAKNNEHLFLLVGRPVDADVLRHMETARTSVDEYRQLKEGVGNFQHKFYLVFIAVAIGLLLAALVMGFIFSQRLVAPITKLVDATERIKAGDLNARVEEGAEGDEMGTLDRAFNRMTEQLARQRKELTDINRQIDERRRLIEAVLSGVSAGVIALDSQHRITLHNRSAEHLLHAGKTELNGQPIATIFPEVMPLLSRAAEAQESVVQQEVALVSTHPTSTFLVRVVREVALKEIEGYVVTFDDITELQTAQRTAAWSDVARRIAHEIKNPLTPIHLAIDRLQRKYGKQVTEDVENFHKYLDTISRHVGTIGHIVEEFVQFARMPSPELREENLTRLLKDCMFSEQLVGREHGITYRFSAPEGDIKINGDKNLLSQVLTNLLKNAREALENQTNGEISISLSTTEKSARLVVEDNGPGFPEELIDRITEPYITTREKGTGLGLAIVKKIITDHNGKLVIANRLDGNKGASITISLPLSLQPH